MTIAIRVIFIVCISISLVSGRFEQDVQEAGESGLNEGPFLGTLQLRQGGGLGVRRRKRRTVKMIGWWRRIRCDLGQCWGCGIKSDSTSPAFGAGQELRREGLSLRVEQSGSVSISKCEDAVSKMCHCTETAVMM